MKVLCLHDPRWAELFAAEAQSLRRCLGSTALQVQHIGGTAIPETLTKPIIDIVVEVTSLDALDVRVPVLERIGYEARGEHGVPGRRYFKKRATDAGVGFHVHSFAGGSEYIVRHIQFRNFLLLEPGIAKEYSALKLSLTSPEGVLVDDYVERKSEFVRRVLRLAEERFLGGIE